MHFWTNLSIPGSERVLKVNVRVGGGCHFFFFFPVSLMFLKPK